MRLVLATAAILATLAPANADFRLYPGFTDKNAIVEMTNDKGLIIEITLRCAQSASGQVKPGIMTYSKLERLFCDPNLRCSRDAGRVFERTCS